MAVCALIAFPTNPRLTVWTVPRGGCRFVIVDDHSMITPFFDTRETPGRCRRSRETRHRAQGAASSDAPELHQEHRGIAGGFVMRDPSGGWDCDTPDNR